MLTRLTPHVFLLVLLVVLLPGCTHDTGAERTEATLVFEREVNQDTNMLTATVRPREESYSPFGSDWNLVTDADVQVNFASVDMDYEERAYIATIPDFTPGTSAELSVTYPGDETYYYSTLVHDLELTGLPEYTRLDAGDYLLVKWKSPDDYLAGSIEIDPIDDGPRSAFADGNERIYMTIPESMRNLDVKITFTLRQELPNVHGWDNMLLLYKYIWRGRIR